MSNSNKKVEVKRVGKEKIFINPSPCCGHNNCFMVWEKKEMAYCFSCNCLAVYHQSGNPAPILIGVDCPNDRENERIELDLDRETYETLGLSDKDLAELAVELERNEALKRKPGAREWIERQLKTKGGI